MDKYEFANRMFDYIESTDVQLVGRQRLNLQVRVKGTREDGSEVVRYFTVKVSEPW